MSVPLEIISDGLGHESTMTIRIYSAIINNATIDADGRRIIEGYNICVLSRILLFGVAVVVRKIFRNNHRYFNETGNSPFRITPRSLVYHFADSVL